jgi:hypothetical protein
MTDTIDDNEETLAEELRRVLAENAALRAQLIAGPDKVLRCAFCGQPYPDGTPDHKSEALAEHIRQCPEHPVGKENRELRAEVERLRSVLCCQGRHDSMSTQAGVPFDEDLSLKHRMEAGHA